MTQVQLWPLASMQVVAGNRPVTAIYGPCLGGFIQNPATAADQGLPQVENLFVNPYGPATPFVSGTTFMLGPGQTWTLPANFGGDLSVTAASSGHRISGVVFQSPTDFHRSDLYEKGVVFPPAGPTVIQRTIPSYLYQQYSDDDDLQAFVAAYNAMTQDYVSWMANINLAVYTSDKIQGALLDWVAEGLYGIKRPALTTGHGRTIGPLNTYTMNELTLNTLRTIPSGEYFATDDDIFKRIMTWHIYKGDGKVFDIRWLKRRIMRFLTGENGTAGDTDDTYPVSITFGEDCHVNVNLQPHRRLFKSGALFNVMGMNKHYLNQFESTLVEIPVTPNAPLLKAALDAGALELPFQFEFTVNIG